MTSPNDPDVLSRQSPVEADTQRSTRDTEAVAWITPLRYGSQVTFYKPPKPANWDDDDSTGEWFCKPLVYAHEAAKPIGEVVGYHKLGFAEIPTVLWTIHPIPPVGTKLYGATVVAASPSDTSQGVSEAKDAARYRFWRKFYRSAFAVSGVYRLKFKPSRPAVEIAGPDYEQVVDAALDEAMARAALRSEPTGEQS